MTDPMATSIGSWLKNSVVEGDVTALIQHEVYRFDLILANPPFLGILNLSGFQMEFFTGPLRVSLAVKT